MNEKILNMLYGALVTILIVIVLHKTFTTSESELLRMTAKLVVENVNVTHSIIEILDKMVKHREESQK